MSLFNTYHRTCCEENKEGNRENHILDTLWKEYPQQAFIYASRIFQRMYSMQVRNSA